MRPVRARVISLLLLAALTFAAGLGRQALSDGDEGYYAEASREMVESGDWLTPRFNYEDRWQKPVLYYWVTAAVFAVAGPSEWGARALSAVSGVLLVLLTYGMGRRLLNDDDEAWVSAAIVATCYGYFTLARLALPDLPLALFITLTIFWWLEGRYRLAAVAAGLGLLDKGPLAVLIPGIVLLPLAWRERRATLPQGLRPVSLAPAHLAVAAVLCLAVAAPWYLAMFARHGVPYLQSFFVGDNLERFATARFNEPRSLLFYVPIVVGGFFPWMAFLLVLPWQRLRGLASRAASLSAVEWRLVCWAAVPLLFFTASVGKQPRYILPVLPPLALLVGASLARHVRGAANGDVGRARALRVACWATAVTLGLLAILLFRAGPVLINVHPWMTLAGILAFALGGVTVAWTALRHEWAHLPTRMAVSACAVLLAVQFGALAGRRPEAVEIVAAQIRAERQSSEPIGTFRVLDRNLTFYTGLKQVALYDDGQVQGFLASPDRVLLVARAQDLERLRAASPGVPLVALGSVDYMDPASIRLSTLLSPDPRRDVTDLILVANR